MSKNIDEAKACSVCGTALSGVDESLPVCMLRKGLAGGVESGVSSISEVTIKPTSEQASQRFEHYELFKGEDGKPVELGRGAMGITYKAFDVDLRCLVTLKVITARYLNDESARLRFLREARAAASVRHPNVASVFHLGESGGSYFYAMEFVEGETLEKLIGRLQKLEPDMGLEVTAQVAAGLAAIQKQQLVHRDIKPSNIMVSFEDDPLENVKIIDLGLAKGVAEEDTISTLGSFTGTPQYASPEQFSGLKTDIRSDLYSLGITLWEMLAGELPFQGSAVDLMYQHQHAALPIQKLRGAPAPIVALFEVLLAKDLGERFQDPVQLQKALIKVKEALISGSRLTAGELRSMGDLKIQQSPKQRRRERVPRRLVIAVACLTALLVGWGIFDAYRRPLSLNPQSGRAVPNNKNIAVLPFENISSEKDDAYFADGVQDEILNNLARIADLKVISRTSVMQYRAENKRDLRQIANALGVSNVLEGTVRRNGNRVRVSTELIDARSDETIWADSYDRDLTNIFAIQSEVAQNVADKLAASLSPEEKKRIEAKPTENLEAYDLYLQANQLIDDAEANPLPTGNYEKPLLEAINFLEQAVRLDPKFTLAYCAAAKAHDTLYNGYDLTLRRR